jgi:hypothetical protein
MMRKSTQRLASIYIDVPALRPGTVGAHVLALVAVAAAMALEVAIDPYVGDARYVAFTVDEMPIDDMKKLVHPDDVERFWANH